MQCKVNIRMASGETEFALEQTVSFIIIVFTNQAEALLLIKSVPQSKY